MRGVAGRGGGGGGKPGGGGGKGEGGGGGTDNTKTLEVLFGNRNETKRTRLTNQEKT